MTALPDSARGVIESAALAHLVTLNADGSPQVTCVWVGLDGEEIVCGHLPRHRKVENIERDPRVVLSIEAEGSNEFGLRHYLVVYGRARITEGGGSGIGGNLVPGPRYVSARRWSSSGAPPSVILARPYTTR